MLNQDGTIFSRRRSLFSLSPRSCIVSSSEDYVLPDETWHVTSYYDNIRTKVASLDHSLGDCVKNYNGTLPTRMCSTKMRVSYHLYYSCVDGVM